MAALVQDSKSQGGEGFDEDVVGFQFFAVVMDGMPFWRSRFRDGVSVGGVVRDG